MSEGGGGGVSLTPEQVANIKKSQAPAVASTDPRAGLSAGTRTILQEAEAGKATLGAEFEEGALGRLDAGRTADISQVIEGRRAALGGLAAPEAQALRERAVQGIQRGTQTALRQLRGQQAGAGVRGASATAQQAQVLGAGQQAQANVERDLFLQNIQAKREGLSAFETSI